MLARLQRAIVAFLLLAAAGGAAAGIATGRTGLGLLAALAVLALPSLVLATEFLVLLAVRRGDPAPRATAGELMRAWAGECVCSTRVFGWQQPFRAERWPDRLEPRGRRGVVFVHGYFCNRGFWNPWLERCTRDGRPFVAVTLEPPFGELNPLIGPLDAAVARLQAATGLAPVIVAHSMGGLVLRAWLAATPDATGRAHRLFTIGTPHRGTWMAHWSAAANARSMRPGSAWLADLGSREEAASRTHAPGWRVGYWSHADNIVMPPSTALWPGAEARHLRATAHVAMAFHPAVVSEVSRALQDDAGAAASQGAATPSVASRAAGPAA